MRNTARNTTLYYLASLLLAAACSPGSDGHQPGELRIADKPLIAGPNVLDERISPEGDGYGFAFPTGIRFVDDRLVVLENGNSRLVVFDSAFHPTGTLGRDGAGPGELRGVSDLDVWQNRLAVTEIGNSRVSIFALDSGFVRSFDVAYGGAPVAFGPDGTIYAYANSAESYLFAVDTSGIQRPFGARDTALYTDPALERRTALGLAHERMAVTAAGVHVYDATYGGLIRFDWEGRRTLARRLPSEVLAALRYQAALVIRDFGGDPPKEPRATITDFSSTDDGQLLLLFPSQDGVFGLLVDGATYEARRLRWSDQVLRFDPKRAGWGGIVRAGRFWRIGPENVTVHELRSGGS